MHFELVNCIAVNLSPTSDLQLIPNMLSGHSTLTIVLRLSLNSHGHRPCLRELILFFWKALYSRYLASFTCLNTRK